MVWPSFLFFLYSGNRKETSNVEESFLKFNFHFPQNRSRKLNGFLKQAFHDDMLRKEDRYKTPKLSTNTPTRDKICKDPKNLPIFRLAGTI